MSAFGTGLKAAAQFAPSKRALQNAVLATRRIAAAADDVPAAARSARQITPLSQAAARRGRQSIDALGNQIDAVRSGIRLPPGKAAPLSEMITGKPRGKLAQAVLENDRQRAALERTLQNPTQLNRLRSQLKTAGLNDTQIDNAIEDVYRPQFGSGPATARESREALQRSREQAALRKFDADQNAWDAQHENATAMRKMLADLPSVDSQLGMSDGFIDGVSKLDLADSNVSRMRKLLRGFESGTTGEGAAAGGGFPSALLNTLGIGSGVVAGASFAGGALYDLGSDFVDQAGGGPLDRAIELERLQRSGDLAARLRAERLQNAINENMGMMAQLRPDIAQQLMTGRRLPRGAVVIGGRRRYDVMTEVASAMAQGQFQQTSMTDMYAQSIGLA